jgi:hypothetical protein
MLDGSTTTHGKLMGARDTMGNTRLPRATRRSAAQLLMASPYPDDRILADRYLTAERAERMNAFAKLNEGTLRRDASPDWGAIVRLGCIVAVMAVAGYFISEAVLAHARAAADAMEVVQ